MNANFSQLPPPSSEQPFKKKKSGFRELFWLSCTVVLGIALLLSNRNIAEVSAGTRDEKSWYENLEVFSEVLSIIRRDYVREVQSKELVEGAIQGMLQKLDPHSGYLDPEYYQDLKVETKGEFGGLGIEITMKDDYLMVVAPMEGSPAEAVGILPGDKIIKINGKFTKDFTLVDAVKKLRGPKGEEVALSIHREGMKGLKTFRIVRDNIQVRSVRSRYLGNRLGYVRIGQFMETTYRDLRKNLDKLSKEAGGASLQGLVLDLRNNPGGLLNQAVQVSDLFLEEGVVVYTDGRMESQKQKYFANEQGTEPKYPLIILINEGSASASEIVAGAMKDHGRAIIVGKRSFGKGSVQTITPLDNGGGLTLTTALYYTKSGKSIQLTGVDPDVEVDSHPRDEKLEDGDDLSPLTLREGDLPGAIHNPQGVDEDEEENSPLRKINKTPKIKEEAPLARLEDIDLATWKKKDLQFAKAWDLLASYGVFDK